MTDRRDGGTCDEIVAATGRALRANGYADLTTRRIADEAGVSTAALHYHYDSKRDLLYAFLEESLARFEARLDEATDAPGPVRRLFALLDEPTVAPDDDGEFRTAMHELEAQAPYDDGVRERLREFDAALRDRLHGALVDAADAGAVSFDRSPADEATFLATIVHGAGSRTIAFGADPAVARRSLRAYVRDHLLVDPDAVDDAGAPLFDPVGDDDAAGSGGGDDPDADGDGTAVTAE